jgi:sec-independent protein translocase protein TatA
MPFNLGPMEMVFVMVVLLLIFGAKRLPELGSGLGKGIREFKRTMRDVETSMADGTSAPKAPELPRQGAWAHVQPPAQPLSQAAPVPEAVAVGQPATAAPAPVAAAPAQAPITTVPEAGTPSVER